MKKKFAIFIIIGCWLIWSFLELFQNYKSNDKYFKQLDLNMTAEVFSKPTPTPFNDYYVLRVKVKKCNIKFYDPRKTTKRYYCIIKDSVAEIYQQGLGDCDRGDIVYINTGQDNAYFVHGNKKEKLDLQLNISDLFYVYVSKYFQKI